MQKVPVRSGGSWYEAGIQLSDSPIIGIDPVAITRRYALHANTIHVCY